ncbi:MAG: four-carbon acid sugar kinase family protein [Firmicutes bacterium]|nr:four-carbon acid sugar kinase family protein [Bacillota bacterium]
MNNVYIIADDTTGANSSVILHKKLGYDCVSIHSSVQEIRKQSAYAFSTNSRGVSAKEAYRVVKNTLAHFTDKGAIYNKRVDSTLRGNLGSELNAFLDYFPNKTAIVVASFPNSGRTCVHNKLYVNGELLENTDVAKDPKMPVTTSVVTSLFAKQTSKKIVHIDLDVVRNKELSIQLLEAYRDFDIVVVDAENNDDINLIANTVVNLELDIITVDPGPFTFYYARSLKEKSLFKFHCLIGSVTPLTILQMKYARENGAVLYLLDVLKLLSDDSENYLEKCFQELIKIDSDFIILSTSDVDGNSKINLSDYCCNLKSVEDISNLINNLIAKLFIRFNKKIKPHCVYTSGGDTTLEFLNLAGSYGLRMYSEIFPLTVESKILGGDFEGLSIVSKGGLIGNEETILHIYNYMKVGRL